MSLKKILNQDINGIVNVDKPYGMSSNQMLQKVRRLFFAKKAGHTGVLDPLATGVLPICFGHATKVSQFILDANKRYQATITLGIKTTTADKEGEIIEQKACSSITEEQILACLKSFIGKQTQIPPMHSALKVNGQPLYKLARKGESVERKSRQISIYQLNLLQFKLPEIVVDVYCSKGTYVRTLSEDIGEYLTCGAHLSALRRTQASIFDLAHVYTLQQLQQLQQQNALEQAILPIDFALQDFPKLQLDTVQTEDILFGRRIVIDPIAINYPHINNDIANEEADNTIRLYDAQQKFLGLGKKITENLTKNNVFFIQPKRLFC